MGEWNPHDDLEQMVVGLGDNPQHIVQPQPAAHRAVIARSGWQNVPLGRENPGYVTLGAGVTGLLFGFVAEGMSKRSQRQAERSETLATYAVSTRRSDTARSCGRMTQAAAVFESAGVKHNIVNTGDETPRLFTVYARPEHCAGTQTLLRHRSGGTVTLGHAEPPVAN